MTTDSASRLSRLRLAALVAVAVLVLTAAWGGSSGSSGVQVASESDGSSPFTEYQGTDRGSGEQAGGRASSTARV
ncbi:hypothetical protein [Streptomyces sp. x-80]|uniref:hypothetical protein n=1 Tax=Streptomyces sp. x-80 TaxID=2789282 RepID=UPI0039811D21